MTEFVTEIVEILHFFTEIKPRVAKVFSLQIHLSS